MDAFTRKRQKRSLLLRFVLREGTVVYDKDGSVRGRGFYLLRENVRPYFEKGAGKKMLKHLPEGFLEEIEHAE